MSTRKKVRKGIRKPRVPRPKKYVTPDNHKYDSVWEAVLHESILKHWQHHGERIDYIIEHTYEPDFIKTFGNKTILLEAKGRCWDFQEYSKYKWIKKALPKSTELVFLFSNPDAPMPQAKKRRDGTKRSHAEWAETNEFRWFIEQTLPKEWKE